MHKFINFHNGRVNVTSYRRPEGQLTTLDDLITCACAIEGSDDYLTADFSADALCKHPLACEFLNRYGVNCGTRHGGNVMVLDWDSFIVSPYNTVMLDIA